MITVIGANGCKKIRLYKDNVHPVAITLAQCYIICTKAKKGLEEGTSLNKATAQVTHVDIL